MALGTVKLGHLTVSRLIVGGNPFSGFSHQNPQRDRDMRAYFTVDRIKDTLRQAEQLGLNTFLGRADRHIIRMVEEYRNEGGTLQWIAQTAPELSGIDRCVRDAVNGGAQAVFLHGGQMDYLMAQHQLDQVAPALAQIRKAGLPAGIAGHVPAIFEWAEENVDVDFYMCAYYNPSSRAAHAEHIEGTEEHFLPEDREAMVRTIQHLRKPVIHYKIFAAGRNEPREGFAYAARYLRPIDAVCVGVFPKDDPDMIRHDIALFEQALVNR